MILVVEAEDKKKRKNKIGVEEDEDHREVDQATQLFSATSVASMTIMQRIITQTSVSRVKRSDIFPKIVSMRVENKRQ